MTMQSMISRTASAASAASSGWSSAAVEALDPATVGLGNAGVQVRSILRGVRYAGGKAVLPGQLKLGEPLGQGEVPAAMLDNAHDLGDGFSSFGKLAAGWRRLYCGAHS